MLIPKIKQLKRNAYGFRNFNNFRTRVFLIFNYDFFSKEKNKKYKNKSKAG